MLCPHRLDAPGLRKLDVVWVHVVCADKAFLEEQLLPHSNHLLLSIVHDGDLHRQVVRDNGRQIHGGHVERAVAVNQEDVSVRVRYLTADREGQPDPHRPQPPARQHLPGFSPSKELTRHHLVVTHSRCDKEFLVLINYSRVRACPVERLYNLLSLQLPPLCRNPRERKLLLPLLYLGSPLRSFLLTHEGQQSTDSIPCIAVQREIGFHGLAELAAVDVNMHDPALSPLGCLTCLGGILGGDARGSVVETASDRDDKVRILHGEVGVCSPVHSQHVQGEGVELVEDTHGVDSRCGRQIGLLCQLSDLIRSVDASLSDQKNGALRSVDQVRNPS
mmetsp:Transcript_44292/g.87422  ORF Transcript_44292/g.87422 Transcript_44292/m.87422 type:complete len:333 (-) Transcript_44292:1185-2183(-)